MSAWKPTVSSCEHSTVRLTGWSSTTSTRLPSASACSRLGSGRLPALPASGPRSSGSTCAGSPTGNGSVSVTVVPSPRVLRIVMSPPISTARRLQITSPRPVPPKRWLVELCACANSANSRACCSGSMPMPVSLTEISMLWVSATSSSTRTSTSMPPTSVNFTALESMLLMT